MIYLAVAFFWGVWGAFLYFGHFWIGLCVAIFGLAIVGFVVEWWSKDRDTDGLPSDVLEYDATSSGTDEIVYKVFSSGKFQGYYSREQLKILEHPVEIIAMRVVAACSYPAQEQNQ